jgi:hypothetical protein
MFWSMVYHGINGMVAYSETETVRTIFKTRIRPMIEGNQCLRELWDGNPDNLTITNILLSNCFWRIASAQDKNDLASTGAGFVIGSEVAKWEKMSYNPVSMLYGRQDAYPLDLRFSVIESSAYDEDDYLYQEMYKYGVLILSPAYPCPHCGEYQHLVDSQIKLREHITDDNTKLNVSLKEAAKIREQGDAAVFYECINCKHEITEPERVRMDRLVKYAAPEIKKENGFEQRAEKILKDGSIIGVENRKKYKTWCFHWHRLVDLSFTFAECLSRFFESVHTVDKKKVYDNETMSRFSQKKKGRTEINSLENKKGNYFSKGNLANVPDGVLVVTAGIDVMDDYFYYVIQGWGETMESWILRCGAIHCNKINGPGAVFDEFKRTFLGIELKGNDGKYYNIKLAMIDRGGHRAEDVDFIVKNTTYIKAYIGLRNPDPKKPVIYKSDNGNYYLGQSHVLSEEVGLIIETEIFHLPQDIDNDFIKQATAQYFKKKLDANGNIKTIFIKEEHDHARSCLNMSLAAAKLLELDRLLYQEKVCLQLKNQIGVQKIVQEAKAPANKPAEEPQNINRNRGGSYFDRAIGVR